MLGDPAWAIGMRSRLLLTFSCLTVSSVTVFIGDGQRPPTPHIPFPLFAPLLALSHTMVLTTSRQRLYLQRHWLYMSVMCPVPRAGVERHTEDSG